MVAKKPKAPWLRWVVAVFCVVFAVQASMAVPAADRVYVYVAMTACVMLGLLVADNG